MVYTTFVKTIPLLFLFSTISVGSLGASPEISEANSTANSQFIRSSNIAISVQLKIMCTGLFVSGLKEDRLIYEDLASFPKFPINIDYESKEISFSKFGKTRKAVFREGMGCVLIDAIDSESIRFPSPKKFSQLSETDDHYKKFSKNIEPKLQQVVKNSFLETETALIKNSRAVIVAKGRSIIAEHYAEGIDKHTVLPGYSITKGVANLLVGALVKKEWLQLNTKNLHTSWNKNDKRELIEIEHLLRMTSGLRWEENYSASDSDLLYMLALAKNASYYAASKEMEHRKNYELVVSSNNFEVDGAEKFSELLGGTPIKTENKQPGPVNPGEYWRYSGGNYEILSMALRNAIEKNGGDYHSFPYENLFKQLGMTSAILEAGPDNNYMLSSFMLATARDWVRLGVFMMDEYNGEYSSILPKNWVRQSLALTEAEAMPFGVKYGAGFWLNPLGPQVPRDTFYLAGFQGQFLVIIPSLDIIILHLGSSNVEERWLVNNLVTDIVSTINH